MFSHTSPASTNRSLRFSPSLSCLVITDYSRAFQLVVIAAMFAVARCEHTCP